jgi:NDP-sugar pyrophosphorylase family protein
MFVQDRGVAYDPAFAPLADAHAHSGSEAHVAASAGLALVMPMAGRGARFADGGEALPKPLIEIAGRPFFWWAVESVRRIAPLTEAVFVLLEEHVRRFAIDEAVRAYYPDARIVALPEVTAGAAETAAIGVAALRGTGPVALCDCDHAFTCDAPETLVAGLEDGADAALLCFPSADPAYSYARIGPDGEVAGTVEKQAVSPFAIAGCYLFASPATYLDAYAGYRSDCPYDEYFVSGVYNRLIESGGKVGKHLLVRHLSFGTPAELARVEAEGAVRTLWPAQP